MTTVKTCEHCETHFEREYRNQKFCTLACRFWSKVDRTGECWEWQGSGVTGYGTFSVDKKPKLAHRVAYELSIGPILEGLVVMHDCDNRRCCNPSHLRAGTEQDNMADMVSKGRQSSGRRRSELLKANHRKGNVSEKQKQICSTLRLSRKLTVEQVVEIRTMYARGNLTQKQVANKFGLNNSTVSNIVRGVYYPEVGGPRTYAYKKR